MREKLNNRANCGGKGEVLSLSIPLKEENLKVSVSFKQDTPNPDEPYVSAWQKFKKSPLFKVVAFTVLFIFVFEDITRAAGLSAPIIPVQSSPMMMASAPLPLRLLPLVHASFEDGDSSGWSAVNDYQDFQTTPYSYDVSMSGYQMQSNNLSAQDLQHSENIPLGVTYTTHGANGQVEWMGQSVAGKQIINTYTAADGLERTTGINIYYDDPASIQQDGGVVTSARLGEVLMTPEGGEVKIGFSGNSYWKSEDGAQGSTAFKVSKEDGAATLWIAENGGLRFHGKPTQDSFYQMDHSAIRGGDFSSAPTTSWNAIMDTVRNPDPIRKQGGGYTPHSGADHISTFSVVPVAGQDGSGLQHMIPFQTKEMDKSVMAIDITDAGVTVGAGSTIGWGYGPGKSVNVVDNFGFRTKGVGIKNGIVDGSVSFHPQAMPGQSLVMQTHNLTAINTGRSDLSWVARTYETNASGGFSDTTAYVELEDHFSIDSNIDGALYVKDLNKAARGGQSNYGDIISKRFDTNQVGHLKITEFKADTQGYMRAIVGREGQYIGAQGIDVMQNRVGLTGAVNREAEYNKTTDILDAPAVATFGNLTNNTGSFAANDPDEYITFTPYAKSLALEDGAKITLLDPIGDDADKIHFMNLTAKDNHGFIDGDLITIDYRADSGIRLENSNTRRELVNFRDINHVVTVINRDVTELQGFSSIKVGAEFTLLNNLVDGEVEYGEVINAPVHEIGKTYFDLDKPLTKSYIGNYNVEHRYEYDDDGNYLKVSKVLDGQELVNFKVTYDNEIIIDDQVALVDLDGNLNFELLNDYLDTVTSYNDIAAILLPRATEATVDQKGGANRFDEHSSNPLAFKLISDLKIDLLKGDHIALDITGDITSLGRGLHSDAQKRDRKIVFYGTVDNYRDLNEGRIGYMQFYGDPNGGIKEIKEEIKGSLVGFGQKQYFERRIERRIEKQLENISFNADAAMPRALGDEYETDYDFSGNDFIATKGDEIKLPVSAVEKTVKRRRKKILPKYKVTEIDTRKAIFSKDGWKNVSGKVYTPKYDLDNVGVRKDGMIVFETGEQNYGIDVMGGSGVAFMGVPGQKGEMKIEVDGYDFKFTSDDAMLYINPYMRPQMVKPEEKKLDPNYRSLKSGIKKVLVGYDNELTKEIKKELKGYKKSDQDAIATLIVNNTKAFKNGEYDEILSIYGDDIAGITDNIKDAMASGGKYKTADEIADSVVDNFDLFTNGEYDQIAELLPDLKRVKWQSNEDKVDPVELFANGIKDITDVSSKASAFAEARGAYLIHKDGSLSTYDLKGIGRKVFASVSTSNKEGNRVVLNEFANFGPGVVSDQGSMKIVGGEFTKVGEFDMKVDNFIHHLAPMGGCGADKATVKQGTVFVSGIYHEDGQYNLLSRFSMENGMSMNLQDIYRPAIEGGRSVAFDPAKDLFKYSQYKMVGEEGEYVSFGLDCTPGSRKLEVGSVVNVSVDEKGRRKIEYENAKFKPIFTELTRHSAPRGVYADIVYGQNATFQRVGKGKRADWKPLNIEEIAAGPVIHNNREHAALANQKVKWSKAKGLQGVWGGIFEGKTPNVPVELQDFTKSNNNKDQWPDYLNFSNQNGPVLFKYLSKDFKQITPDFKTYDNVGDAVGGSKGRIIKVNATGWDKEAKTNRRLTFGIKTDTTYLRSTLGQKGSRITVSKDSDKGKEIAVIVDLAKHISENADVFTASHLLGDDDEVDIMAFKKSGDLYDSYSTKVAAARKDMQRVGLTVGGKTFIGGINIDKKHGLVMDAGSSMWETTKKFSTPVIKTDKGEIEIKKGEMIDGMEIKEVTESGEVRFVSGGSIGLLDLAGEGLVKPYVNMQQEVFGQFYREFGDSNFVPFSQFEGKMVGNRTFTIAQTKIKKATVTSARDTVGRLRKRVIDATRVLDADELDSGELYSDEQKLFLDAFPDTDFRDPANPAALNKIKANLTANKEISAITKDLMWNDLELLDTMDQTELAQFLTEVKSNIENPSLISVEGLGHDTNLLIKAASGKGADENEIIFGEEKTSEIFFSARGEKAEAGQESGWLRRQGKEWVAQKGSKVDALGKITQTIRSSARPMEEAKAQVNLAKFQLAKSGKLSESAMLGAGELWSAQSPFSVANKSRAKKPETISVASDISTNARVSSRSIFSKAIFSEGDFFGGVMYKTEQDGDRLVFSLNNNLTPTLHYRADGSGLRFGADDVFMANAVVHSDKVLMNETSLIIPSSNNSRLEFNSDEKGRIMMTQEGGQISQYISEHTEVGEINEQGNSKGEVIGLYSTKVDKDGMVRIDPTSIVDKTALRYKGLKRTNLSGTGFVGSEATIRDVEGQIFKKSTDSKAKYIGADKTADIIGWVSDEKYSRDGFVVRGTIEHKGVEDTAIEKNSDEIIPVVIKENAKPSDVNNKKSAPMGSRLSVKQSATAEDYEVSDKKGHGDIITKGTHAFMYQGASLDGISIANTIGMDGNQLDFSQKMLQKFTTDEKREQMYVRDFKSDKLRSFYKEVNGENVPVFPGKKRTVTKEQADAIKRGDKETIEELNLLTMKEWDSQYGDEKHKKDEILVVTDKTGKIAFVLESELVEDSDKAATVWTQELGYRRVNVTENALPDEWESVDESVFTDGQDGVAMILDAESQAQVSDDSKDTKDNLKEGGTKATYETVLMPYEKLKDDAENSNDKTLSRYIEGNVIHREDGDFVKMMVDAEGFLKKSGDGKLNASGDDVEVIVLESDGTDKTRRYIDSGSYSYLEDAIEDLTQPVQELKFLDEVDEGFTVNNVTFIGGGKAFYVDGESLEGVYTQLWRYQPDNEAVKMLLTQNMQSNDLVDDMYANAAEVGILVATATVLGVINLVGNVSGVGVAVPDEGLTFLAAARAMKTVKTMRGVVNVVKATRAFKTAWTGAKLYHLGGGLSAGFGQGKNLWLEGEFSDLAITLDSYTSAGRIGAAIPLGMAAAGMVGAVATRIAAVKKVQSFIKAAGKTAWAPYAGRAAVGAGFGGGRAMLHDAEFGSSEFLTQAGVGALTFAVGGGVLGGAGRGLRQAGMNMKISAASGAAAKNFGRSLQNMGTAIASVGTLGGLSAALPGVVNNYLAQTFEGYKSSEENYGFSTAVMDFYGGQIAVTFGTVGLGYGAAAGKASICDPAFATKNAAAKDALYKAAFGRGSILKFKGGWITGRAAIWGGADIAIDVLAEGKIFGNEFDGGSVIGKTMAEGFHHLNNVSALWSASKRFSSSREKYETKTWKEVRIEKAKNRTKFKREAQVRWAKRGQLATFRYGNVAEWASTAGFVAFAPSVYTGITGNEFDSYNARGARDIYRGVSMALVGTKLLGPGLKNTQRLHNEWFKDGGKLMAPYEVVGKLATETGGLVRQLAVMMPFLPLIQAGLYAAEFDNAIAGGMVDGGRVLFGVETYSADFTNKIRNDVLGMNVQNAREYVEDNIISEEHRENIFEKIEQIKKANYGDEAKQIKELIASSLLEQHGSEGGLSRKALELGLDPNGYDGWGQMFDLQKDVEIAELKGQLDGAVGNERETITKAIDSLENSTGGSYVFNQMMLSSWEGAKTALTFGPTMHFVRPVLNEGLMGIPILADIQVYMQDVMGDKLVHVPKFFGKRVGSVVSRGQKFFVEEFAREQITNVVFRAAFSRIGGILAVPSRADYNSQAEYLGAQADYQAVMEWFQESFDKGKTGGSAASRVNPIVHGQGYSPSTSFKPAISNTGISVVDHSAVNNIIAFNNGGEAVSNLENLIGSIDLTVPSFDGSGSDTANVRAVTGLNEYATQLDHVGISRGNVYVDASLLKDREQLRTAVSHGVRELAGHRDNAIQLGIPFEDYTEQYLNTSPDAMDAIQSIHESAGPAPVGNLGYFDRPIKNIAADAPVSEELAGKLNNYLDLTGEERAQAHSELFGLQDAVVTLADDSELDLDSASKEELGRLYQKDILRASEIDGNSLLAKALYSFQPNERVAAGELFAEGLNDHQLAELISGETIVVEGVDTAVRADFIQSGLTEHMYQRAKADYAGRQGIYNYARELIADRASQSKVKTAQDKAKVNLIEDVSLSKMFGDMGSVMQADITADTKRFQSAHKRYNILAQRAESPRATSKKEIEQLAGLRQEGYRVGRDNEGMILVVPTERDISIPYMLGATLIKPASEDFLFKYDPSSGKIVDKDYLRPANIRDFIGKDAMENIVEEDGVPMIREQGVEMQQSEGETDQEEYVDLGQQEPVEHFEPAPAEAAAPPLEQPLDAQPGDADWMNAVQPPQVTVTQPPAEMVQPPAPEVIQPLEEISQPEMVQPPTPEGVIDLPPPQAQSTDANWMNDAVDGSQPMSEVDKSMQSITRDFGDTQQPSIPGASSSEITQPPMQEVVRMPTPTGVIDLPPLQEPDANWMNEVSGDVGDVVGVVNPEPLSKPLSEEPVIVPRLDLPPQRQVPELALQQEVVSPVPMQDEFPASLFNNIPVADDVFIPETPELVDEGVRQPSAQETLAELNAQKDALDETSQKLYVALNRGNKKYKNAQTTEERFITQKGIEGVQERIRDTRSKVAAIDVQIATAQGVLQQEATEDTTGWTDNLDNVVPITDPNDNKGPDDDDPLLPPSGPGRGSSRRSGPGDVPRSGFGPASQGGGAQAMANFDTDDDVLEIIDNVPVVDLDIELADFEEEPVIEDIAPVVGQPVAIQQTPAQA
ncbi:MAG: hypothetical protein GY858_06155, partial [Candidatus Omnitrophica bacterium]|nr:hypothetical protein [Candidatus Omnitrophota bacterium]